MVFKFGGATFVTTSLEGFVGQLREGAVFQELDEASYLEQVALRFQKFGYDISGTSATEFVLSLLASGLLVLEGEGEA